MPSLTSGALDRLMDYSWPGNARELENAVERELIVSRGGPLAFRDIPPESSQAKATPARLPDPQVSGPMELDRVMARHIRRVLKLCDGRVEGEKGAARILDIHPSTLRKRMKKLGVVFGRQLR